MRLYFSFVGIVVLTACVSTPKLEPNTQEWSARVTSKTIVGSREQKADGTVYGAVPIGGVFVPIMGAGTKSSISIYEYTVVDALKTVTKVQSEAPFFEIGQCVKLITANTPTYPRLAYGADCVGF
jgi:hypothetical protein